MAAIIREINITKDTGSLNGEVIGALVTSTLQKLESKITDKNRRSVGIFLGTTFNNFDERCANIRKYRKGGPRLINPADFPRGLLSYLSGYISTKFNIQGFNGTLSSGPSSGVDALTQALYFTARNKSNRAVVVELGEALKGRSGFLLNGITCFLIENQLRPIAKKSYACIIGIESFFERRGKNTGLSEAIKSTLQRQALKVQDVCAVFTSSPLRTPRGEVERQALDFFGELPVKSASYGQIHYGLSVMGNVLLDKYFERITRAKKNAIMFFVNLGENSNSSCIAVRIINKGGAY